MLVTFYYPEVIFPTGMPTILQIAWKKISADRSSLACQRSDGTVTWSRVHAFFPVHDLTHFAVESILGLPRGFFGLIAEGWDLADFTQPGVAARLPRESLVAENIVGTIERVPAEASLAEFTAALADSLLAQQLPPFRAISAAEYTGIHRERLALIARWRALPVGETLRLEFALAPANRVNLTNRAGS